MLGKSEVGGKSVRAGARNGGGVGGQFADGGVGDDEERAMREIGKREEVERRGHDE